MQVSISLKCLFCNDNLHADTDKTIQVDEMITCINCGEKNDFDSVRNIAIQEGKEEVKKAILESLQKKIKNIVKK